MTNPFYDLLNNCFLPVEHFGKVWFLVSQKPQLFPMTWAMQEQFPSLSFVNDWEPKGLQGSENKDQCNVECFLFECFIMLSTLFIVSKSIYYQDLHFITLKDL